MGLDSELKLYDRKYGHYVGFVRGNTIQGRWGNRLQIKGYAVLDDSENVVGTFGDGVFEVAASNIAAEVRK